MTPPVESDNIWRLATALSGAVSADDVATALAAEGAAAAGATFSNMAMYDADTDRVRMVHGPTLSPELAARWTEVAADQPTPLNLAIQSASPVLLEDIDAIESRFPDLVEDTVGAGLAATASLPLRAAGGTVVGAIGFGWAHAQRFDSAQRRHLDLIANMVAQSFDRALLYEREREHHAAADRAEARLLQEAFLPARLPRTEHLEVAAAYLPASDAAMGGDWYDAFSVDGGTCFVIGDVAGHGLRSAAVMALVRNAARAYANEDPSPALVLGRLNRMLCRLEPEETVTAIIAVWHPETRTLHRATAGHPPPLRCREGEFGFLVPQDKGVVLGADPGWTFHEEPKVLRPGTTVLFYTDGLIESRDRSLEDGMDDLRAFVEGIGDLAPQAVCDAVLAWRIAAAVREDDVCLLAVRLA